MKIYFIVMAIFLSGCTVIPYEELRLDTTSNFQEPTEGKAGVYVYQWKTGVLGAGFDVDFEMEGAPQISLNTGEYGYFELAPGNYEYKVIGGLMRQDGTIKIEAGKNYFFRAFISNFSDVIALVRDQKEIDETKKNILNNRYELYNLD